jgi:hypothetical protein
MCSSPVRVAHPSRPPGHDPSSQATAPSPSLLIEFPVAGCVAACRRAEGTASTAPGWCISPATGEAAHRPPRDVECRDGERTGGEAATRGSAAMEWTSGTVLWSMLVLFFWLAFLWMFISIFADILRRDPAPSRRQRQLKRSRSAMQSRRTACVLPSRRGSSHHHKHHHERDHGRGLPGLSGLRLVVPLPVTAAEHASEPVMR